MIVASVAAIRISRTKTSSSTRKKGTLKCSGANIFNLSIKMPFFFLFKIKFGNLWKGCYFIHFCVFVMLIYSTLLHDAYGGAKEVMGHS